MNYVSLRPKESWSDLAYIYSTICKSVFFTLLSFKDNYEFLPFKAFFCHLLPYHMKVFHAKSIATANSLVNFRKSPVHYKARPLPETATLTGDFALFHPVRSERRWGLNGAFYLLAPQLQQRLSLGGQLPNIRLRFQHRDSATRTSALPQDWDFSHITLLALLSPPSPRVRAVVINFGKPGDWYIH